MLKKQLLLSVLFLVAHFSMSQPADSLKQLLNETVSTNDRIQLAKELVSELKSDDLEEARNYALAGVEEAEEAQDFVAMRELLNELGDIHSFLGQYDKGISYLLRAETIPLPLGHSEVISTTFNIKGKIYYKKGNYDKALGSFQDALQVMEKSGNMEGQAFYLNNIGVIYDLQSVYDKALEYYQRSLDLKIRLGMEESYPGSLTNLGITYFNLGDTKNSLIHHEKALQGYKELDDVQGVGRSLNNIGFAYFDMEKYDLAIDHFLRSVRIRTQVGDTRAISQTYTNIAQAQLKLGNLDKTQQYADSAFALSMESGQKQVLKNLYQLKSDFYEKQEDFESALEMSRLYSSYLDSLKNEEVYQQMAEMEAKYELSTKERQLEQQDFELIRKDLELAELRQRRNFYTAVIVSVLILAVFLIIRSVQRSRINRLMKNQLVLIEQQKNQLKSERDRLYTELSDKKEVLDRLFSQAKNVELPPELLSLSKREMEVLSFLALGWTDSDIAAKMFISKSTVKTHLRRIYSKLMVKGRAGAVAIAHKYKILGTELSATDLESVTE